MFERPPADASLSQGDIIDDCPVYHHIEDGEPSGDVPVDQFAMRVYVLTQACDLAQSKTERVTVAVVHDAQELVARGALKAAFVRDQIRRGQVYGWYFLPARAGSPLPESLIDLRDLHTVPRRTLERLASSGKRLARLVTPYREHLAQHFAVTYMRIGLPEPYETAP